MPKNPIKWGIKVWMLAEPKTGYVSNFAVYLGKCASSEHAGQTLGTRVVLDMSKPFHHTHRHLYFDNFFNSQEVVEALLKVRRHVAPCRPKGTLLPSRLVGGIYQAEVWGNSPTTEGELVGNPKLLYCHQTLDQTRQSQYSDGRKKPLTSRTLTCQHPSSHTINTWEVST